MENKYGKQEYPVHKVMKNFVMSQKTIPLHKLVSVESDDALFRTPIVEFKDLSLQWMSYTHAGSFVTYLIETYGLEKFEKVYNQSSLDKKFQEIYGKTTEELEKEWLLFIDENYEELDTEDKMKIDYFYEKISAVDLIDKEIFKRS
ncbi:MULTISPECIES: hypothetical protein [unclassified Bacillus (in: firmicutes)]|uniref:hypothetical protein n=1 Tax=unclassified Bacillus (in: firmicutes) TaxID=185979 RepID=UPI0011141A24|nr:MULTISPECIES: hypothetical protein [unclassified Bacillus (in: firmicutes)]